MKKGPLDRLSSWVAERTTNAEREKEGEKERGRHGGRA
jgi:hypothetical protein